MDLNVTQVAGGLIATVLTEIAKRVPQIPLDPEKSGTVRAFVAVLSFASAFAVAWADGSLDSAQFSSYAQAAGNGLVSWIVAHMAYNSYLK